GFLRERITPVVEPNGEHLAKLITSLDSDQFRVRQAAAKELSELGRQAIPALEEALRKGPSVEVRQRVQDLLNAAKRGPTGPEIRQLRAVQVLELIGTTEARAA